jgi:hypothetical protein
MLIGLIAGGLLVLTGTGAVWGTTAAAASGRLRRNAWAGIRLGSTGVSDAAWLAGHQAALPTGRVTGLASLVLGMTMTIDGAITRNNEGSILFWVLFVVGYGGLLIATIVMAVQASRAARATGKVAEAPGR